MNTATAPLISGLTVIGSKRVLTLAGEATLTRYAGRGALVRKGAGVAVWRVRVVDVDAETGEVYSVLVTKPDTKAMTGSHAVSAQYLVTI
jgi:hypothetical protein